MTIGLFVIYCILILYYKVGWKEVRPFLLTNQQPVTKISVIIAARNEEENIGKLLTSLESQTYPDRFFEVIVVDDHSTDNTVTVVQNFASVKLIRLQLENINSYKKKAIETGIAAATGDLIVTTDADCVVNKNWLKIIAAFKEETKAIFIAAPVVMQNKFTLLQAFQSLDFLMLQGITAAAVQKRMHNMCNGANLAYERKAFFEVNGFSGVDHIASGDDMLLMQKLSQRFPGKISYLLSEDAIVTTKATKAWKEFFSQRIRWASKATNYNDMKILGALLVAYFFNCSIVALFIAGFWIHDFWWAFAGVLMLKTLIEIMFIHPVARFYNKQNLLKLFPLLQPLHVIYTVIAGWLGMFGSFEWKGRRVK